jgi:hypothetical protein
MVYFRGSVLRAPTLHTRGISKRLGRVLGFRVISRDVAQLVARTAGGREVASSSLVIPTMK